MATTQRLIRDPLQWLNVVWAHGVICLLVGVVETLHVKLCIGVVLCGKVIWRWNHITGGWG
jgi:hypothetical protein